MERNIARLGNRLARLGVGLRPHLKTAKSLEVARLQMPSASGPATVSTLREAEVFAAAGVTDMIYAVGVAPQKLPRVARLRAQGVDLAVVLDSVEQARAVAAAGIPGLIEIDADGHRAGIRATDRERLLAVARLLAAAGVLRGVLTHAGGSYQAQGAAALERAAEQERAAVVDAAETLRGAELPCPVVSVGSTPTAHFARDLSGVTEVRAGVYVFFDLVMADLGVCTWDDIAISVLATVIGHQPDKGWTLTDAGWMATSRDLGSGRHGYGVVCDVHGVPISDAIMSGASQEHGVVALRPNSQASPMQLPVGTRLRLWPNHACATAAQFDRYHVVAGTERVEAQWPRFGGW